MDDDNSTNIVTNRIVHEISNALLLDWNVQNQVIEVDDNNGFATTHMVQNVNNAVFDSVCRDDTGGKRKQTTAIVTNVEPEESVSSNVFESPNGTKYWIPSVPDDLKPKVNSKFDKWEDIAAMYEAYAQVAGFSTRLGILKRNKKGIITNRHMMCNKAGKPSGQDFDSMDGSTSHVRRSNFIVTDCKARIKVKAVEGTSSLEIYGFIEAHNHGLVSSDNLDLTRSRRKWSFADQEYIAKCRLANVGPSKAYKLPTVLKGGHHNVHGTKTDFKNFDRDMNSYIGDRDAEMVVDRMKDRKVFLENFTFEHRVQQSELRCMFWADDVAKFNYEVFGDVLAFDAMYHTNKYNMIFVPFTGVDHHKKCVTFGAALLYDETIESYKWLLQTFLKAHGGKQPTLVLTDQDTAMKQAVNIVFDKSIHRLCMWHIMKKLSAKISGNILDNTNLRACIHKLGWNVYIKPSTFEERWHILIDECNLHDNAWLSAMFAISEQWVPGYFRELQLCCLIKTTSRCESLNSLFKLNFSGNNTLVQFMLCFDSALDEQRYNQRCLEHKTATTTTPKFIAKLPIERHVAEIYTRTIFKEVQKEIVKSKMLCYIVNRLQIDGKHIYTVAHQDHRFKIVNEFKVTIDLSDNSATCSCMGFTQIGYLCRHVFCCFRHHGIDKISNQYVHMRRIRDALPKHVFSMENRYGVDTHSKNITRHRILDNIQQCIDRLRGDADRLALLDEQILHIKNQFFSEFPEDPSTSNKQEVIKDLIGPSAGKEVQFTAPKGIRNKGSGTCRRLIGPGEKAVAKRKKKLRKCWTCLEYVNDHDSRNCPEKEKEEDVASGDETPDTSEEED